MILCDPLLARGCCDSCASIVSPSNICDLISTIASRTRARDATATSRTQSPLWTRRSQRNRLKLSLALVMSAALSTALAGLTAEAAPAPLFVERMAVERATTRRRGREVIRGQASVALVVTLGTQRDHKIGVTWLVLCRERGKAAFENKRAARCRVGLVSRMGVFLCLYVAQASIGTLPWR